MIILNGREIGNRIMHIHMHELLIKHPKLISIVLHRVHNVNIMYS